MQVLTTNFNSRYTLAHQCKSLGGIEYLIMGGKGTNLSFEDLEFKNQKLITYSIKNFKLQPKALFTLRSSSIPKCQHFKLLVKFKLSPIFIHPCSFFCHLKKNALCNQVFLCELCYIFWMFLILSICKCVMAPKITPPPNFKFKRFFDYQPMLTPIPLPHETESNKQGEL